MAKVMDQGWVKVQHKTFSKWVSNHLVKKFGKDAALTELSEAFEDGQNLTKLLNSLYDHPQPKLNKNPKMRPHLLDNVTLALRMLEDDVGVKTNFLKTTHLVDKDLKMILGMIWAIILHYQIAGISVEELSAKEGLLLWCQKKTKGYRDVDPPTIKGFTSDWANGMAFCALIHRHRPDLIDYDSLDKADAAKNLELAFSVAENELGIPRLLDVEDLVDVAKPDERSVMTQVSEYFHCFSKYGEADEAGKRIAQLVATQRAIDKLKQEYEHNAAALREWILAKTEAHKQREFDGTLAGVEGQWSDFNEYRKAEKPQKTADKLALESQFSALQTKLRVQNRPPFEPSEGLGPRAIDQVWDTMLAEEKGRVAALREELERQQRIKVLVDRFTRRADALCAWADANKAYLSSSDVGQDLASVQAHLKTLEGVEADYQAAGSRLGATKAVGQDLVALGYREADRITGRIAELDELWATLAELASARRTALEAELARLQHIEDLRVQFATQGRVFANWVEDADVLREVVRFHSLEEAGEFEAQLAAFRGERDAHATAFDQLRQLADELTAAGVSSNIYATHTMDDLTAKWEAVARDLDAASQALAGEQERLRADDDLNRQFATAAQAFQEWATQSQRAMEAVGASVATPRGSESAESLAAAKIAELEEKGREIAGHKQQFDELVALDQAAADRAILFNPHTEMDMEGLKVTWDSVQENCRQQIDSLEKSISAVKANTGVDPEQLAEFKDMFQHFDKDKSNTLEKHEFKACLNALGISKTDAEMDAIMQEVAASGTNIQFDEFVGFMTKLASKDDSADAMTEAFKVIAGSKSAVTEQDLRQVLDGDTVDYLIANMEKDADGNYDYASFSKACYLASE